TDLAVYRDGAWHVLSSGQGEAGTSYSNFNFGNGTDQPAAAN
ncbi:MAG: hypothetical protein JWN60_2924, partial [Acidobacteria bacterium]|nr:hypothetical protein [Acidobacteriota bacterium]